MRHALLIFVLSYLEKCWDGIKTKTSSSLFLLLLLFFVNYGVTNGTKGNKNYLFEISMENQCQKFFWSSRRCKRQFICNGNMHIMCVCGGIKLREVILDKIDKVVQFLIPYRNIMASVLDSGITRLVVPLQVQ